MSHVVIHVFTKSLVVVDTYYTNRFTYQLFYGINNLSKISHTFVTVLSIWDYIQFSTTVITILYTHITPNDVVEYIEVQIETR